MLIIRNPYGESPLTALAVFETEKACRVRVTVKGDITETDFVSELPMTKYHRIPILGLYPGRENRVCLELLEDNGDVAAAHVVLVWTMNLPNDLQNVIEVKKVSDQPAFQNILVSGGLGIKTCMFDRQGQIRFYIRRFAKGYGVFPLGNGHFFYMEKEVSTPTFTNPQTVQSYDMDYLGRTFMCYLTKNGVHHTAAVKVGGNILAGSNTGIEHTEDKVIEIDRTNGEIVWSLSMDEIFDDYYVDMRDWAHLNSAEYYEKDNSILLSLRNLHTVCLVDYTTKELKWILADPKFWKKTTMTDKVLRPVGEVPWIYQQHAAYELDEDFDGNPDTKHILIFDNHWAKRRKAKSFDKDPLSYVSIYTVDEKNFTVSLYKRFGFPKTKIRANGIYCPKERRMYSMAGWYAEPIEDNQGGIYEFDFDTGELVSDFRVKPGFFRAYNFEPDMEELAKPVQAPEDYVGGELRTPVRLEEEIEFVARNKVKHPAISLMRQEEILFAHGVDHQIRAVYFVGEHENYVVQYGENEQTMDIFREVEYYLAFQIHTLPNGRYDIYLDVDGDIQNTEKWVELKR